MRRRIYASGALGALGALVLVNGCGNDSHAQSDARIDGMPIDAAIDAREFIDSNYVDPGPRGPKAFDLPGVGNALYWDDANSTLYGTDDTNHALWTWTDAAGFTTFGTFPTSTGLALGELLRLADNSWLTPTAGNGTTTGTIHTLTADGTTAGSLTGLDATRKRTGVAQAPGGLMYTAYYTGGTGTPTGGVSALTIATTVGTETPIVTSVALKKTISVLATDTNLYVCDQTTPKIYKIVIATGATSTFASTPSCDQLSFMPNGDILTGGLTGAVYRVAAAGTTYSTVASGLDQPRGTAYDPTGQRLFIVEHVTTVGGHDRLHIAPVDN